MTFTLKITLGNDAMQTPEDIAGALRDAARRINGLPEDMRGEFGKIRDSNGNTCGKWEVKK